MSTNPPQRLGKYELQTRLGEGGMAEVWKAFDPQLKRYVAIKFLHAQLGSDPDFMIRFEREGQAIASLRHPNIVLVYDFQTATPGSDNSLTYMVMDYVEGQTLAEYIRETSGGGSFLSSQQLVRLFTPICLAVDYAHEQGIIHRDIKPANILLDARQKRYNTMGEPILTDFGIVKMIGAATLTMAGTSLGTPLYISPEQVKGLPGNEKSDIYSLGVMLYQICAGTPPFRGDSPYTIMLQHVQYDPPPASKFNPKITPELDAFLARCLAKQPEERFPTASAMAAAFAQALHVPVPEQLRQFADEQSTGITQYASEQMQTASSALPTADIATLRAESITPPSFQGIPSADAGDLATIQARDVTPSSFQGIPSADAGDLATIQARDVTPSSFQGIPSADTVDVATMQAKGVTPPFFQGIPSADTVDVATRRAEVNTAPVLKLPPSQDTILATPGAEKAPTSPAPQPVLPLRKPPINQRKAFIMIASVVLLLVGFGSGLGIFFVLRAPGQTPKKGGAVSASIVGHASFFSSQQLTNQNLTAINDGLSVQLQHIAAPSSGNRYYAWLQDNQTEPVSIYLGTLNVNNGTASLTYTDAQHRDLLGMTSIFLVTEETASVVPNAPSIDKKQWRYYAALPQTRSPRDNYSYLDHVRHLLSGDPELDHLQLHRGVDFWFLNNIQEMQKETIEVRDHVTLSVVRQQIANILYYLDGKCAPQDLANAPGSQVPENNVIAHDSVVGLLDCAQAPTPPGYLAHISSHLSGIAQAPGAPASQVQRAIEINNNLSYIKTWLNNVRSDALQLATMNDTQLSQARTLRSDMAVQAEYVLSGGIDPTTQNPMPSAGQIANKIELLANFDVTPYKA